MLAGLTKLQLNNGITAEKQLVFNFLSCKTVQNSSRQFKPPPSIN